MGVIRGGLLVIIAVLLFVSLFATYILLTMSWSLNYDNVQKELGDVIKSTLNNKVGVTELVATEYSAMQEDCKLNSSYVINYEDIAITIPCEVISQGQEAVINYSINKFIEGVYYKHYDCKFWGCFSEKEIPFFLVSSKAQSYWYSKFNYALMIVGVLCVLGFLLAQKKGNFFILLSALIIITAIPFAKIGWFIGLLGKTAGGLLSVFFSKGFTVFIRAIIFGAILLVIGIIFKLFGIGFKIQSIFSKKEEVKEIVREEIAKEKEEVKEARPSEAGLKKEITKAKVEEKAEIKKEVKKEEAKSAEKKEKPVEKAKKKEEKKRK